MDWEYRLIRLYVQICHYYRRDLWGYCQRMSNHSDLSFSDEEVICIYLYGIIEKRRTIKDIYDFTHDHLSAFFPNLPSYEGYGQRLNQISDVFIPLVSLLQKELPSLGVLPHIGLMDSMPISLAKAKRSASAKVAPELANKGYCASKGLYYYGVKVHLLGLRRPGTLPVPEYMGVTPASDHDLTTFRQIQPYLYNRELFLDKAYADELLKEQAKTQQNLILWTPVKKKKGQKGLSVHDQWLSTAVSRVRQPIESLFNWIEEKTGIQSASKVRSYKGLLVHVFGRLAAALFIMAFSS